MASSTCLVDIGVHVDLEVRWARRWHAGITGHPPGKTQRSPNADEERLIACVVFVVFEGVLAGESGSV